jgi:hemolysin activation/secretion protein
MVKMSEIAAAVRSMLCVGSVLVVGMTGAKSVMAADADAGSLTQDASAMNATPVEAPAVASVNVVPAQGADAILVKQLIETDIRKLGDAPGTLKEVDRWSDVLTVALQQGGFPLGQVLMTQEDWQATQRGAKPQFTAFPGRVRKIILENKSRVNDARLQRLIAKALCGSETVDGMCLLRTSRLERATQLLQDVPGVALADAPKVSPGEGVGEVDVTFKIAQQGKPVSADVIFDNNGSEATGTYRLGLTASANNLFGLGESYAFTITGTEKQMWTGSLTGSLPIFDDGLRMTGGVTRQQYTVNAGTAVKGVATTGQIGVQYPFMRGLDGNLWGGMSYLHSNSKSTLDEYQYSQHGTINSLQLSLSGNNGERARALRTNMLSGSAALTLGHLANDDPYDYATRRAGNYAKLSASGFATYNLNAKGDLFASATVTGQLASANLDGSEKLGLGGPNAVRAYRTDEGSADEGVVLNLGIYKRLPIATGHQLQLGLFNDFAYGRVNHSPWYGWENTYPAGTHVTNNRILAGYGASVDWLTPIGATVSASVSKAYGFSGSSWADPGKKPVQVWMSVTWSH